jgi:DNA segregation ATPase FtsK/SpoIIIE-like protein
MKWLKNNSVEIVLFLGLTPFLINFFGYQGEDEYVMSIPILVLGLIMLYKRHFRSRQRYSDASLFASDFDDDDDMYEDAKDAVIEAGKASTSFLQRKLRIGYSRSARLMDLLEENEVIGPANGSEPREILQKEH